MSEYTPRIRLTLRAVISSPIAIRAAPNNAKSTEILGKVTPQPGHAVTLDVLSITGAANDPAGRWAKFDYSGREAYIAVVFAGVRYFDESILPDPGPLPTAPGQEDAPGLAARIDELERVRMVSAGELSHYLERRLLALRSL